MTACEAWASSGQIGNARFAPDSDRPPAIVEGKMTDTLYKRLGGYDAIAAVADDLLPRLMADAQLGRFWQNRAEDSLRREKQLLVDFLCASSGGPLYFNLLALWSKKAAPSGAAWYLLLSAGSFGSRRCLRGSFGYATFRRRRKPRATRPTPSSAKELGSGTGVVGAVASIVFSKTPLPLGPELVKLRYV